MRFIKHRFEKLKIFINQLSTNAKYFLFSSFISFLVFNAFNILLGIYLKEKGFEEALVGSILSIQTLSIGIGSIPAAIILDLLGNKKSLLISMALIVIGGVGVLNTNVYPIMIGFSIIYGFGFGIFFTIETPFLYENGEEKYRVSLYSSSFIIKNSALVLGSLSTGYISDVLKVYFDNVEANRLALLLFNLLVIISIYPILKIQDSNKKERSKVLLLDKYKEILSPSVLMFLLYSGLIGMGAGFVVPYFSMYLKYTLDISETLVGTILSFSQMGTVIVGFLIPHLAYRFGKIKFVILCQFISIPFLISIAFPQGIIVVAISFFIRSALMNMAQPITQNLAMDLVKEDSRAMMSSMRSLVNYIFRAIGIYIGGIVMDVYSYNTPYYITVITYALGVVVFISIFKNNNEPRKEFL